jgi:6-phosphofructokinase
MARVRNILVGQSGGPTAAINASLAGVMDASRELGLRPIGMRYGIKGLLDGRTVDLSSNLPGKLELELLRHTPASYLGSCRYKLPDPEKDDRPYRQLFGEFDRLGVGYVLYIGGNDSMDTIARLSSYGESQGSDVRFVGVPKTIDNDLLGCDHTPGYGSAAKFVATATAEIQRDSDVYDLSSVTFVEIMGRDAGWLAAASTLAGSAGGPSPDVVLLPEVSFDEGKLLDRISNLLGRQNTVIVAVSEGLRAPDGKLLCERASSGVGTDEFGHLSQLSGTGRYLAALTRERIGCKTRCVELSTLQRCASTTASAVDLSESRSLGAAGVLAATDSQSGVMVALERTSTTPYQTRLVSVDVTKVADKVRRVPRHWITPDGMNLTRDFELYARPLVRGEDRPAMVDGVPQFIAPLRG